MNINWQETAYDMTKNSVGSFFVSYGIPTLNPIHAVAFAALKPLVEIPLKVGGSFVAERYGPTIYNTALWVANRCTCPSTGEVETEAFPQKVVRFWSSKPTKDVTRFVLNYLASTYLTCSALQAVGISFTFSSAIALATGLLIWGAVVSMIIVIVLRVIQTVMNMLGTT